MENKSKSIFLNRYDQLTPCWGTQPAWRLSLGPNSQQRLLIIRRLLLLLRQRRLRSLVGGGNHGVGRGGHAGVVIGRHIHGHSCRRCVMSSSSLVHVLSVHAAAGREGGKKEKEKWSSKYRNQSIVVYRPGRLGTGLCSYLMYWGGAAWLLGGAVAVCGRECRDAGGSPLIAYCWARGPAGGM